MMEIYRDWLIQITRLQADKKGMSGLCRLLMGRMAQVVFVTDLRGNVLSWESPEACPLSKQERIHIPQLVVDAVHEASGTLDICDQQIPYSCWVIHNREKLGYLWVLKELYDCSEREVGLIECIRLALVVEVSKNQEQGEFKQNVHDELIRNIVFDDFDNINTIGMMWGWSLSSKHTTVMIIKADRGVERRRNLFHIRAQMEECLSAIDKSIVSGMLGEYFTVLYPIQQKLKSADSGKISGKWNEQIEKVFMKLQQEFPRYQLRAGVGDVYWETSNLCKSYQEAEIALRIGGNSISANKITFFRDLGAIRLFQYENKQELKNYFVEILGAVQKYDLENDGSLLMTLWSYFTNNSDQAIIASELNIHPNTIRVRLRKIEEILGGKLDHQELRFNIFAALKIGAMFDLFKFKD